MLRKRLAVVAHRTAMPEFVCNLGAIPVEQRPRYRELVRRLRHAILRRDETPDDYRYGLDATAISLVEAAEWVTMERLCCPFLALELSTSGREGNWRLTLTGPQGAKPLIDAEFPARPAHSLAQS